MGRCKAEKQACRFTDASDPEGGHYETIEEMEAYRERRAEQETSGLQEGIAGTFIDSSSLEIGLGRDIAPGGNSSAGLSGITTRGKDKGALRASGNSFYFSPHSGPKKKPSHIRYSRLMLPEGFEKMSKEEKVANFCFKPFTLRKPDGSNFKKISALVHWGGDYLEERRDYLNRAFGPDKETGETFTESISRRYKNHPSISSKIESLGSAGIVHTTEDSEFDSLQKDEIVSLSSSLVENGATIDFSKPDSLIEVQYNEASSDLDLVNEEIKGVISSLASKEFDYSKDTGDFKDTHGEYLYLNQNFARRVNKLLLDEREAESGEPYHFYKEYLRGYAKAKGLEGKAPDESIKSVFSSGYRMSEEDIKEVIEKSRRLYHAQKDAEYNASNALGDTVKAHSGGISIGNMTIDGAIHRQDQSVTGGTRIVLGYSKKGGELDLGINLDFNPKTGEGAFRSLLGKRGAIVTDLPPFKLTKSLPEDYTEADLRNFIMSEKVRFNVFQGKPWSKITFKEAEK